MRNGDESGEDLITTIMTINLNVLGALMKGEVICDEDRDLIVTIHGHCPLH